MGIYKAAVNPFTGDLQLVPSAAVLVFRAGVANAAALPPSGNATNDARITNDTGHLWVWSGTAWVDEGDVLDVTWDALSGKPTSSPANIDDAVTKRHSSGSDNQIANTVPFTPNGDIAASDVQAAIQEVRDDTDTKITNAIAGVNPAVAVQAATTSASDTSGLTYFNGVSGIGATLTGTVNTALTVDGYTFTALGQRLLVKNDTQSPSGAFNGVYYVTQVQTISLPLILTRALDYNKPSDINNTGAIPVINGTINGTTQWVITSTVNTVGTDPLTFAQFTPKYSDVADAIAKKHTQNTDTGTTSSTFQIDNDATGPKLKNSSGKVQVRNEADDAYAGLDALSVGDGTNSTPVSNLLLAGIDIIADGFGNVLTTGVVGDIIVPFDCTIIEADMLADQSGSIVVDIFKCTQAQYDAGSTHPVSGDKITSSTPPTISTATKSADTTLTSWTVTLTKGDVLRFNINSVTTVTRVTLHLELRKR